MEEKIPLGMGTMPMTLTQIKEMYPIAVKNGTVSSWYHIIMQWAQGAEDEIKRLQLELKLKGE